MYFQGNSATDLFRQALEAVGYQPTQPGRDQATLELMHVMFHLGDPRRRLVTVRDINPAFAFAEILWIMAGGNNVRYLEFWNKRMWDFALPTGLLYGAYGTRLGAFHLWLDPLHMDNGGMLDDDIADKLYIMGNHSGLDMSMPLSVTSPNQLYSAYTTLKGKPNSRQAVLQIWDSRYDLPYDSGAERAPDVPCNTLSHLMVREGRLEWLQVMRSNDGIWGFPYNVIQWTMLQEIMAGWLAVEPGHFVLVTDSWHVYQRHWHNMPRLMARRVPTDFPRQKLHVKLGIAYEAWHETFLRLITAVSRLADDEYAGREDEIVQRYMPVGYGKVYASFLVMMAAEAMRIRGNLFQARNYAEKGMQDNPYWMDAWIRWSVAKEAGEIL
jgi:thymidylate synthase